MVPKLFIYCYWVWAWTVLYLFGFAKVSPMLSAFITFIFTTYNQFFSSYKDVYKLDFKITIVLIEFFVFLLLFYVTGAFDFSTMKFRVDVFFKDIYYNILILVSICLYCIEMIKHFILYILKIYQGKWKIVVVCLITCIGVFLGIVCNNIKFELLII